MQYITPQTFWVLHPDRPEGPEWRRCTMSITRTKANDLYVTFKVRRLSNGAMCQDLYDSMGFRACLDRIFEDILRESFPDRVEEYRQNYIMRSGSRSFSDPQNGGSPTLGFSVSNDLRDMFDAMSNHKRLAIEVAAKKIAAREEKRRAGFGPKG
jgi:hypothetical protein